LRKALSGFSHVPIQKNERGLELFHAHVSELRLEHKGLKGFDSHAHSLTHLEDLISSVSGGLHHTE